MLSNDADNDDIGISFETFKKSIVEIKQISDRIQDNWEYHQHQNGEYITKRIGQILKKTNNIDGEETVKQIIVQFEYHITYNINYAVPVFCFIATKQDGTLLQMEEYCEYNRNFADSDILSTLTQLDHPVLCRPFLTLHPCRTIDFIRPFLKISKNPVISWMSVIFPYLNIKLDNEYVKAC